MNEARQAGYAEQLLTYSQSAIEAGIDRTIKAWDKPNMLPPIGFILARIAERYADSQRKQLETRTKALLSRPAISDWETESMTERGRYARAYANASQPIREVMKTKSTIDALAYAESRGVRSDALGALNGGGIASGLVNVIERGHPVAQRSNGYVREPGDEA